MMKIIVLHDRYSNEPIIMRADFITVIQKRIDRVDDSKEEYSTVSITNMCYDVKEHIGIVATKIKNAIEGDEQCRY